MSTLMLLYVRSLAHNLRSNLPVLCFGMVLWTSAKIYFAFQCDSHMWNLTSGCMHHADQ